MTDTVDRSDVVETIPCSSAEEFIRELTLTEKRWHRKIRPKSKRTLWIFRGQGNASWPLRPSLWRLDDKNSTIAKFLASTYMNDRVPLFESGFEKLEKQADQELRQFLLFWGDNQKQRIVDIGKMFYAESKMVEDFYQRADRAAHRFPYRGHGEEFMLHPEDVTYNLTEFFLKVRILEELGRKPHSIDESVLEKVRREGYPIDKAGLPLLALVQHHGVPTSLLDWTLNPFVAAYFAASSKGSNATKIAVWALNQPLFLGDAPGSSLIKFFSTLWHEIGYLQHQNGMFTYVPSPCPEYCSIHPIIYFIKHGKWPGYDDYLASMSAHDFFVAFRGRLPLRKVTLPVKHCKDVLDFLDNFNISRTTLMPTLDNVTFDLKRYRWEIE